MRRNSCKRTGLFAFAFVLVIMQGIPAAPETIRVDGNKVRVNAGSARINSQNYSLIGGGTIIITDRGDRYPVQWGRSEPRDRYDQWDRYEARDRYDQWDRYEPRQRYRQRDPYADWDRYEWGSSRSKRHRACQRCF